MVYGCGGVGLLVIMIVNVIGVNVVVIDIFDSVLELVCVFGVVVMVNVLCEFDVVEVVWGIM